MSARRTSLILLGVALLLPTTPVLAAELASTNLLADLKLGTSPVRVFREVLVMTPEERESFLMIRPLGMREPIEAKIAEYLAMPAEERELRLQATELRHYLQLLMPAPPTNHSILLAQIAEPMRSLVKGRLEMLQLFPDPMRGELIANEQALRYFTQFQQLDALQRRQLLDQMPVEQRTRVEADIARWRNLSPATREHLTTQLNQFFDLNAEERQRTLASLSEPERAAMEKTLESFRDLPPDKREQCLRSFAKFTAMPLAERQLFLKKAEAWQKMTPTERQRWRELVQQMPLLPPLPDGFAFPAPSFPSGAEAQATNSR